MQERTHHRYVYNGSALIAEIDATTRQVLRAFAWGATGELLMINDRADTLGPQTYLPVRDAAGSVTGVIRAAGSTTVATYEYGPDGNLLRAKGEYAEKNPFTYAGGWMDWETGLINAGSVYYSARIGRFINTAPSGNGDGMGACFGVAPAISYLPLPSYTIPSGRRSAITASWQSVDPTELAAYEAAWAAYAREWAAFKPEWAAYEKWFFDYTEALSNACSGEPPEDYSADEFDADRFNQVGISIGGMDVGTTTLMGAYGMMHDYYGIIQDQWYETYYGTFRRLNPDGSRAGYYDAEMDQWVYPDGSTASFGVTLPDFPTDSVRITPGSKLGDALRGVPLIGGILGGVGDVLSGIGNVALATVTLGKYGSFGKGALQVLGGLGEIAGRVWSLPNTAIGLTYGIVGMLFGARPSWDSHAGILRFEKMPSWLMPGGMSLGSVNVFGKDSGPTSDNGMDWGITAGREESLHTIQSRILGPLYIPLHLTGMGSSALISVFAGSNPHYPEADLFHRFNIFELGPMAGRVF